VVGLALSTIAKLSTEYSVILPIGLIISSYISIPVRLCSHSTLAPSAKYWQLTGRVQFVNGFLNHKILFLACSILLENTPTPAINHDIDHSSDQHKFFSTHPSGKGRLLLATISSIFSYSRIHWSPNCHCHLLWRPQEASSGERCRDKCAAIQKECAISLSKAQALWTLELWERMSSYLRCQRYPQIIEQAMILYSTVGGPQV